MTPSWKGQVRLGLVAVPVKLFTATSPTSDIMFNLVHRGCGNRIKKVNVCSACNVRVDDIIKGYKHEDKYVLLEDSEIKNFRKKASGEMKIFAFVKKSDIHPIYYSGSYYMVPDGKIGNDSFPLFFAAMQAQDKVAIAKTVISGKDTLLALHAYKDVMIAYRLFFSEELRKPDEFKIKSVELDKASLKMVEMLVRGLSSDWNPDSFKSEHKEAMKKFLAEKAEGKEKVEEVEEVATSFLDSLKASIEKLEVINDGTGMAQTSEKI